MKAIVSALLFAGIASSATPLADSRVTGTFSSLAYDEDSGDLGGTEISIVYGGGGHYAIVQCSEGEPGIPVVLKVQVQGQKVAFTVPKGSASGCPEAAYSGIVGAAGLTGQFTGFRASEFLRRKPSYWQ